MAESQSDQNEKETYFCCVIPGEEEECAKPFIEELRRRVSEQYELNPQCIEAFWESSTRPTCEMYHQKFDQSQYAVVIFDSKWCQEEEFLRFFRDAMSFQSKVRTRCVPVGINGFTEFPDALTAYTPIKFGSDEDENTKKWEKLLLELIPNDQETDQAQHNRPRVMDPMNQPRTPQKEVLQRMRPQFVEFLNFDTPNFLEKLYHKSVINDAIKIKVKRKDQLQKNRIILDYLEMQPSVVFDEFLEILQDVYPQLHKEAQDMMEEIAVRNAAQPRPPDSPLQSDSPSSTDLETADQPSLEDGMENVHISESDEQPPV